MKMVRSLLLIAACAGTLSLGACATDDNGGSGPAPSTTNEANVNLVIDAVKKGCNFVAYAPTIAALIGNSIIVNVADVANLVCSKVKQVQTAGRNRVNREISVNVNGVTVKGHFASTRSRLRR